MYKPERNEDGVLLHVRREPDGVLLNPGQDCADWRALLDWNARQQTPLDLTTRILPSSHVIFGTVSGLVEYCRKRGIVLFTSEREDGEAVFVPAELHDFGTGTVYRLQQAVTPRQGAWDDLGNQNGMIGMKSHLWVSQDVWFEIQNELKIDASDVRRVSTWTTDRAFVYVDISDFSRMKPGSQVLVINSLVGLVKHQGFWNIGPATYAVQALEAMLCIGDGYIFVFKDPEAATFFAAYLAQLIEESVARRLTPVNFHFRVGVHFGPVYSFWDWGRGTHGDWNYIGEGINGGQRVLTAIGKDVDDVVFISAEVRHELLNRQRGTGPARQLIAVLQNKGRRLDKHGKPWRVYEVNHTSLAAVIVTAALMGYSRA